MIAYLSQSIAWFCFFSSLQDTTTAECFSSSFWHHSVPAACQDVRYYQCTSCQELNLKSKFCLLNQRGSVYIFIWMFLFERTPQLKIPTPSLYLWDLGAVRPSFSKEKGPSQEWESGIVTAVTSMRQCLLYLLHLCEGQSGNWANTLLLFCVCLVAFSSALGTFGQKWPVASPELGMRLSCLKMSA